MPTPHVAFAEIVFRPEFFAQARDAVRAIVAETLSEGGCDAFALHEAADGSPRLFIYERWRDEEAFAHHHAQPYTRLVFERYREWLAEPVRLTIVRDVF